MNTALLNRSRRWSRLGGIALFCGWSLAAAQAATYNVDPNRSSLVLSASFGGTYGWGQFTITGQVAGAMSACLEGTIAATSAPDGSLTFSGGSSIRARLNSNSASPNPAQPSFRPTGSDPNQVWNGTDNFGALCFLYDKEPIYIAYRGLALDIPAGRASVTGEVASSMRLAFTAGHRDWSQATVLNVGDATPTSGWPLAAGQNLTPDKITVSADGSTVTIPVVLVTRSYDLAGIVYFDEIWTGKIVAVSETPNSTPLTPTLSLAASGPAGLQFNASGRTATHFNGINTAPWVEGSWVSATRAHYSFTITNPPAPGAAGFQAYVWLVANPAAYSTEEFSGPANPNVVRLVLESDGRGGASATLGYRVNAPNDSSSFSGRGLIARLDRAPFAGTWNIDVSDRTIFTLTAPDGTQAQGSMPLADTSFFAEKVRFYLGVNPNGEQNLGRHMTVSRTSIEISRPADSTSLIGDFTTGNPLRKDWTLLGANPAGIVMLPLHSSYRIEWSNVCRPEPGAGTLEHLVSFLDEFGDPATWMTLPSTPRLLANGMNVVHVTETDTAAETGFFRVRIP